MRIIPEQGVFNGLCAGVAYNLEVPVGFIRFATIILLIMFPVLTIFGYFILSSIFKPMETPDDFYEKT